MEKYFAVFNISWQQGLVYRLNFVLWRFRTILQLLLIYFVWWTVFQTQRQVFGYTQASILTYIFISTLVRTVVLSSRIMDVAGQINEGNIVNFLIKPLSFINYYFSRDIADKMLNSLFMIVEITIIFLLLRPEIIVQTNIFILLLFMIATALGLILFFFISFTFGLLAFWLENIWGIYFLFFMLIEGLGGGIFPIDILPTGVSQVLLLTPFPYLLYFPAKIYLGTMTTPQLVSGFLALIFWVIAGYFLMIRTLQAGLKHYTAGGH